MMWWSSQHHRCVYNFTVNDEQVGVVNFLAVWTLDSCEVCPTELGDEVC